MNSKQKFNKGDLIQYKNGNLYRDRQRKNYYAMVAGVGIAPTPMCQELMPYIDVIFTGETNKIRVFSNFSADIARKFGSIPGFCGWSAFEVIA